MNKQQEINELIKEANGIAYSHKLTSFFASVNQGKRDTQDKFIIPSKLVYENTIDKMKSLLKGVGSGIDKVLTYTNKAIDGVTNGAKTIVNGIIDKIKSL